MRVLTDTVIDVLCSLPASADARRMVSLIPLGSIYWEDEMPDLGTLAKLSEDERNSIWRLFGIRFKIERLSPDDQLFWDAARANVPGWALFRRLTLSANDRKARTEAEAQIAKEFEAFFDGADEVEVADRGHGLQELSATFDLTEKTDPAS